jgi:PPOX class probable F420-dependent enzyme
MGLIPADFQDLVSSDSRAFAYLATVMKDGSPQLTIVWFSWDGTHFLINTAEGRTKDRNMRHRPAVALVIADRDDPYRFIQVRGKAVEITYTGADDHINQLSLRYDHKPWVKKTGQVRVIYKILPEQIMTYTG